MTGRYCCDLCDYQDTDDDDGYRAGWPCARCKHGTLFTLAPRVRQPQATVETWLPGLPKPASRPK